MSRLLTDLFPDVRIAAAGAPEFVVLYYLSRALSEFLDRSEVWRENIPAARPLNVVESGLVSWPNHLDDTDIQWARIKRIDMLRYYNSEDLENEDGDDIPFMTEHQMQMKDWKWRDRLGERPLYFTRADEQVPDDGVSQHTIRVYPQPTAEALGEVRARVVVITDVIADAGLSDYDAQIPRLPDRVFYPFRNGIVSGALAQLYLMPGKDWSDARLAAWHQEKFDATIVAAQSRGDRDHNNAVLVTQYGGL